MLLENGVLIDTEFGYALNTEYFPIIDAQTTPTAKQKEKIDEILTSSSEKAKKVLLNYYDPNTNTFSGLKGCINDFLNFCLSGVPKRGNKVQQPDIKYIF